MTIARRIEALEAAVNPSQRVGTLADLVRCTHGWARWEDFRFPWLDQLAAAAMQPDAEEKSGGGD